MFSPPCVETRPLGLDIGMRRRREAARDPNDEEIDHGPGDGIGRD
jgi:hypothetical protein